ncbi:MAG: hypothetical protein WC477_03575 [Patescibacteria group bacterium]
MRKTLLFILSFALCLSAKTVSAAPMSKVVDPKTDQAFNALATRAYGDTVCGPTLLTANLPWVADPSTVIGTVPTKPVFPRNTACIVTQSYVRVAGAQLQSRETFEHARAGVDSAETVKTKSIQPFAMTTGEAASQSRVNHRMPVAFYGMAGTERRAQLALLASEYGWEKANDILGAIVTLDQHATSSIWNARLAAIIASSANIPGIKSSSTSAERADMALQNADGSMWSFVYQERAVLNGTLINDDAVLNSLVVDVKNNHWTYMQNSTVSTDHGTYGPFTDAVVSDPWLLADGSVMYVLEKQQASSTVQILYQNNTPVAVADEIGIATYLPNATGVVYTVRTSAGWSVVANNTPSQNWIEVSMLRVDPETGSVAYLATGKDGKKVIVFNSNVLPITWTPTVLDFNGGNHQPYALDATGRFWTPTREWKYSMTPDVRAADSHGRVLAFTTVIGQYIDMWADDSYIGRFTIIDEKQNPPLSVKKELDPYFPGYVMTYGNNIAFDSLDQLVVYRQEGRVFTRTAYKIK